MRDLPPGESRALATTIAAKAGRLRAAVTGAEAPSVPVPFRAGLVATAPPFELWHAVADAITAEGIDALIAVPSAAGAGTRGSDKALEIAGRHILPVPPAEELGGGEILLATRDFKYLAIVSPEGPVLIAGPERFLRALETALVDRVSRVAVA